MPRLDHSWFFPHHLNFIHFSSNTINQIYKHKRPFHFSCTWMYKDLSFQETNLYMYFRVFQHKLLNIKFGHKKNSLSGRWRKIHKTEACNTDTTPTQPRRNYNTHRTKNNTTNVVIQQNSRKVLMMDILMSEKYWAHKKWNKIASNIKLILYSSTITTMDGPINIRFTY